MGGWFRKEIKTIADLKGLKIRIGGYGGSVLAKLGAVHQQIAAGDIYPALEKGTIDAAEWVGPYDDEKLGFNKVAKFYYYPGWWEGGPELDLFVNLKAWNDLPKDYQSILEGACHEANVDMVAKYDAVNPPALRRLIAGGTQLRGFSREVMQACYKATIEVNDETAAKNDKFKKIYEPWKQFRDEQDLWFSVAENNFDNFMIGATRGAPAAAKK
jgi:TRAP-type mannitol/chloroaromatic compound transport system substrate-binding protein